MCNGRRRSARSDAVWLSSGLRRQPARLQKRRDRRLRDRHQQRCQQLRRLRHRLRHAGQRRGGLRERQVQHQRLQQGNAGLQQRPQRRLRDRRVRATSTTGACGTVCAGGDNAAAACRAGKCVLSCNAGYLDCDGDAVNGCETNGSADLSNCGNCGNVCPSTPNLNAICAAGTCITAACKAPQLTCKPGPIDGCEVNSATICATAAPAARSARRRTTAPRPAATATAPSASATPV